MSEQQTELRLGDGQPKPAGAWDYYGSLDPAHSENTGYKGYSTFSVGVFRWVAKGSGNGTKKSKTIKRFSGSVVFPQVVYSDAIALIKQKEQEQEHDTDKQRRVG